MKRILVAALLALGIHGLFFGIEPGFKKNLLQRPKSRVMTMTLSYRQPQRPEKFAVKKPDIPSKKPVLLKKKLEVKPKPQKKLLKPLKTIKAPALPKPLPEPEQHELVEELCDLSHNPEEDVVYEVSTTGGRERRAQAKPVIREARPLYRINPSPRYPRSARKRGYQGTVVLEVLVDRNGKVSDLLVFRSSGYKILDRTAMASVKDWLFEPGLRGDEKVEMWVRVPIRFQLK